MFGHDPLRYTEPQTGAASLRFRGKKGIEDGMKNVLGNAASGINDFHRYIRGVVCGKHQNFDIASLGRSVDGV